MQLQLTLANGPLKHATIGNMQRLHLTLRMHRPIATLRSMRWTSQVGGGIRPLPEQPSPSSLFAACQHPECTLRVIQKHDNCIPYTCKHPNPAVLQSSPTITSTLSNPCAGNHIPPPLIPDYGMHPHQRQHIMPSNTQGCEHGVMSTGCIARANIQSPGTLANARMQRMYVHNAI
jgi:hypothetical protein